MDIHEFKDMAKRFDNFPDERDYKLLEKDKYTFFVLTRIIGGQCNLLLTDHERLIICFSCSPYPIWIWTADDATQEEKQIAYELIKCSGLLIGNQTFNMKYDLSEYFIKRAPQDAKVLSVKMNMFAYSCPKLIEPHVRADGTIHKCTAEDVNELTKMTDLFHRETGIDQDDIEVYRHKSEEAIKSGNVFFWRNKEGRNVATCGLRVSGDLASVMLVYTREEYRRMHYAENLVFEVTKIAKDAGLAPMLYTNADYVASNACYKKIGYVPEGKLCTIG